MRYVLIGLLKAYRAVISPLYGNVCKYYPSCSGLRLGSSDGARLDQGHLAGRTATAELPSVGRRRLRPGPGN